MDSEWVSNPVQYIACLQLKLYGLSLVQPEYLMSQVHLVSKVLHVLLSG